jgi:hypothetical protein
MDKLRSGSNFDLMLAEALSKPRCLNRLPLFKAALLTKGGFIDYLKFYLVAACRIANA